MTKALLRTVSTFALMLFALTTVSEAALVTRRATRSSMPVYKDTNARARVIARNRVVEVPPAVNYTFLTGNDYSTGGTYNSVTETKVGESARSLYISILTGGYINIIFYEVNGVGQTVSPSSAKGQEAVVRALASIQVGIQQAAGNPAEVQKLEAMSARIQTLKQN